MDEFKGFITQMIFRWLLKILGGYFAVTGALNPQMNEALAQLAGGIAAILVGLVISIFQHRKAVQTDPRYR